MTFFDAKFLILLTFIIVNFIIIFAVKTRTSIVISLIISHLAVILLFAKITLNYEAFKEASIALIIYSVTILFLIANHRDVVSPSKIMLLRQKIFFCTAIFLVSITLFCGLFFTVKKLLIVRKEIAQKSLVAVKLENDLDEAHIKTQLMDNFLFKRSSDIILLIVASSSILLILSQEKK